MLDITDKIKIKEAFLIIERECRKHDTCKDCPFAEKTAIEEMCRIKDMAKDIKCIGRHFEAVFMD